MKNSKSKVDIFFSALAGLVFIIFVFVMVYGNDGLIHLYRLKQLRNDLATKNRHLMLKNLSLIQNQKGLFETESVEKTAKATLGMVYPDEIVFVTGE